MDRATAAKTRSELDRLMADLPTDVGAARRPSMSARSRCSAGPGSTVKSRPASAKARPGGHRWTGGPPAGRPVRVAGPVAVRTDRESRHRQGQRLRRRRQGKDSGCGRLHRRHEVVTPEPERLLRRGAGAAVPLASRCPRMPGQDSRRGASMPLPAAIICGPAAATDVMPVSAIETSSSLRMISMALVTPCCPPAPRP